MICVRALGKRLRLRTAANAPSNMPVAGAARTEVLLNAGTRPAKGQIMRRYHVVDGVMKASTGTPSVFLTALQRPGGENG